MERSSRILFAVILLVVALLLLQGQIRDYFSTSDADDLNYTVQSEEKVEEESSIPVPQETDYFVDDSIYEWDDKRVDWVSIGLYEDYQEELETHSEKEFSSEPIKIAWKKLLDIQYRLQHFETKEVDMFSPVFGEELEALNGKEVIIEGFVIPFDEEGELIALSSNPYSSCYFCGNASPASVISMFLKDKDGRYDLDDYKKFKGKLRLNYDDPDLFYYVLEDAEEI
ncbi:MAG: hypothetical protein MI810_12630 [Flavobacteriales bacterium]|nr:hypothetical protein [Flavobacteriales bacterium]